MLTTKKKHIQAIDTQAPPGLRYLRLGGVKFFDSLTEIFKSLQLFQIYLAGAHKSAKAFANISQILPSFAIGHG